MQSSAAMQSSCTCGKCNCFFPVNEEEKDKEVEEEHKDEEKRGRRGGRDHNYNPIFRTNVAEIYSWPRQLLLLFQ